jgi:putative Mg2+ transporter-C (MgtC) family protein
MISVHIQDNYNSNNSDPARICAQIVSGMGFLGSATIFKSKNYVKGINTAANLWISAAISMSIGAGLWEFGLITAIFVIIILFINNCYKRAIYSYEKKHDIEMGNLNTLSREPADAPYGDENEMSTD